MRKKYSGKHFLLLLLFATLSFISYAQVTSNRDVIYLKNGSVIKGIVMEMVPGGAIKIKTADGSIFIYPMDEILKTEKEQDLSKRYDQENSFNSKGYFIMARVGPCINPDGDNTFVIVPSFINGIKLNEYLSIGVGVETLKYTFINDQVADINMYPVFFDTRFYIPKKRIQPMFSLQIGYGFGGKTHLSGQNSSSPYVDFIPKSQSGGAYMAIGAGMRVYLTGRLSFVCDGGFALQSMKGYTNTIDSSQVLSSETRTMPLLKLNVGIAISFGEQKKQAQ